MSISMLLLNLKLVKQVPLSDSGNPNCEKKL